MECKEVKVYRAVVSISHYSVDEDMCPFWEDETVFDEYYYDLIDAKTAVQKKFNSQPVNTYVRHVTAEVYVVTISKGSTQERLYHTCKRF